MEVIDDVVEVSDLGLLDPSAHINLSSLLALGGTSPVLQGCIDDDTASMRSLRLVSKSLSPLALLALRKYTLTLKGDDTDTNVSGASLLQQAKLSELIVHLRLTVSYNPAYHLEEFVRKAGPALATVTCLELHYEDTGSSTVTAAELGQAIAAMVGSCPALLSLRCLEGHLTPSFLQALATLGDVCPSLASLEVYASAEDGPYLKQILQLQPSLFPHVSKLTVQANECNIPDLDLSSNISIVTLTLSGIYFQDGENWRLLPPNLRFLECSSFASGPPAIPSNGTASLRFLQSVMIRSGFITPLESLARLLQAAPALQVLTTQHAPYDRFFIQCIPGPTMLSDLSAVRERTDFQLVSTATYWLDCGSVTDTEPLQQFFETLPRMTGITRVHLDQCLPEDVGLLLTVFADVEHLQLRIDSFDDISLAAVASSLQLVTLTLSDMTSVTPMGLLALCLRLPTLRSVTCEDCSQLTVPALEECTQLLREYGVLVSLET